MRSVHHLEILREYVALRRTVRRLTLQAREKPSAHRANPSSRVRKIPPSLHHSHKNSRRRGLGPGTPQPPARAGFIAPAHLDHGRREVATRESHFDLPHLPRRKRQRNRWGKVRCLFHDIGSRINRTTALGRAGWVASKPTRHFARCARHPPVRCSESPWAR